jgi:hypothetical protein
MARGLGLGRESRRVEFERFAPQPPPILTLGFEQIAPTAAPNTSSLSGSRE